MRPPPSSALIVILIPHLISGCSFHLPSSGDIIQNDKASHLHAPLPLYSVNKDYYDNTVDICTQFDDEQNGSISNATGCLPSGSRIQWEGDLNNDGTKDYIIINQSGRWGESEIDMFFVLLGAGNGLYYKQGELFTTSLIPTSVHKNGFRVLKSQAHCIDVNSGHSFDITSTVTFDVELAQYRTDSIHTDERVTLCSLNHKPPTDR